MQYTVNDNQCADKAIHKPYTIRLQYAKAKEVPDVTEHKKHVRSKPTRMRDIFRSWLFILILVAFVFTFTLTYFTQRKQTEYGAGLELSRELDYFSEQIANYAQRREALRNEANSALLDKARLLALAIARDPALLNDGDTLQKVADVLKLDALYITDETGVIRTSIPHRHENTFDFHSYDTTRPYLALITGETDFIVEEPRPNDDELATTGVTRYQQFAGVPRQDEAGIVQVAYSSEQYDSAIAAVSLENCATGYMVGASGFLVIYDERGVVSATTPALLANPPDLSEASMDGGSFHVVFEGRRYMAQAIRSGGVILLAAISYDEVYENIWMVLLWIAAFYVITFTSIFLQVSRLLDRVVVNNIDRTNAGLKRITSGELDERIEITDNQEFRELSGGINATVDALKHFIAQAEDRIRAELALARAIQISALPSVYPKRDEFALHASMTPAKEVGGDFYDFFPVDGNHLALVIADVSGKGIPAALFMMKSKTLIKGLVESGLSPAEVLQRANQKLCEGNEAEMFVTVWLGILSTDTGRMLCANAGHEYPALCRYGQGYQMYKDRHGLVLAAMENARFTEYELELHPGDRLFVYTDGSTEAINQQEALFGTDRLLAALDRTRDMDVKQALAAVHADIDAYASGMPQFDDITMMILELPYSDSAQAAPTLTLCPTIENTEQALSFVRSTLADTGISKKCANKLCVATDELFSNIVKYSGATQVRLHCIVDQKTVTLRLEDNGEPFDPLSATPPNLSLGAQDRPVGGLGLHIVKSTMKTVQYAYQDPWNSITLTLEDAI